jgi:hexosaminidase
MRTLKRLSVKFLLQAVLCILSIQAFAIRPTTIPALREWTDQSGSFTLTSTSRIVLDKAYSNRLSSTGSVFVDDIKQLTGFTLQVVSAANAAPSDIFLSLGSADAQLGKEGYSMNITNQISIKAITDTGAFYGTRTILQLLKQSLSIAGGKVRDWPDYTERSFMIDNGRKYITVNWLMAHIKDMAYLKLNVFQLHLSDNEGFRLKSTVHPEISSAQCYTRADMDSVQAVAKRYKINIIPEIDMPGHMGAILAKHPELKTSNGNLDLTKEASYTFIKSLLNEFVPWFKSVNWHTGADEFKGIDDPGMAAYAKARYGANAVPRDVYIGFVNTVDSVVKSKGKILRAWSDVSRKGVAVKLKTDITMDIWYTYGLSPQQLIDEGHLIINSNWDRLYYAIGHILSQNDKTLYEVFSPNMFIANQNITAKDPKNLGAKFHVWCDDPNAETETQLAANIYHSLRNLSQKSWGSPLLVSTFKEFAPVIGKIRSAPGLTKTFFGVPDTNDIALYKPVTVSSLDPHRPGFLEPSTEIYHAADGDLITRWKSADSGPQWMQLNLLATYKIDRIKLTWEDGFGSNYKVDVSTDNVNWTNVYSTTNGNGGVDNITFPSRSVRYIKLYGTPSGGYSLWECEVYGPGIILAIDDTEQLTNEQVTIYTDINANLSVRFNLENEQDASLRLFNLHGQLMFSTQFKNVKTETKIIVNDHLSPGMYLCEVNAGTKRIVQKFLVR